MKSTSKHIFLLLLFSILFFGAPAQANSYIQRYLEIKNIEGQPINNAKIEMSLLPVVRAGWMPQGGGPMGENAAYSIGNGIYNLDSLLPEGVYRVVISAGGYKTVTFHRKIPYGNVAKIPITLAKLGKKAYYMPASGQISAVCPKAEYLLIGSRLPLAGTDAQESIRNEVQKLKQMLPNLTVDPNSPFCIKWPQIAEERKIFEAFIRKSSVIKAEMLYFEGGCTSRSNAVLPKLRFTLENELDTNKIKKAMPHFDCDFRQSISNPMLGPSMLWVDAVYNKTLSNDFFKEIEVICKILPVVDVYLHGLSLAEIPEKRYYPQGPDIEPAIRGVK